MLACDNLSIDEELQDRAAQLDQLAKLPKPDIVTLMLGGNDLGSKAIIEDLCRI
jgi:lysophospholipase L1-like esterase